MTALHARQRLYDRLHHLARLFWMEQDNPAWSDGTPLTPTERRMITDGSKLCLSYLRQGTATNSVDLNDATYVAELDAFAAHFPTLTTEPDHAPTI